MLKQESVHHYLATTIILAMFLLAQPRTVDAAEAILDAVFANRMNPDQQNRACLGDGQSGFSFCEPLAPDGRDSWDMAMGDVNNDGHLDAVFANVNSFSQVCLGTGTGAFSECRDIPENEGGLPGVALGDVNQDTFLDVVFAGNFTTVCLGEGTGNFSCTRLNPLLETYGGAALADLNNDTFLDLVVTRGMVGESQACLGNGNGSFVNCQSIASSLGSFRVVLADINGDSFSDIIFAGAGNAGSAPNRQCLGNGNGTFALCTPISPAINPTWGLDLADLNGDSQLDIVFANNRVSEVCLADGQGGFSCSYIPSPSVGFRDVALDDVNGDNFIDALFAVHSPGASGTSEMPNLLCLGDGQGSFHTCEPINDFLNDSHGVELVELNTIDQTPPVVTPNVSGTSGNNGWYVSDVTISWTVVDDESDISSSTGCETVILSADTAGQIFTCSATSEGGTTTESVPIQRDATAPVVSLLSPPDGATYVLLQPVTADWVVTDNLSGLGSVNATAPSGTLIDTATPGTQAFTVQATDLAGNTTTDTHSYTVLTASEGIDALIVKVQSLGLPKGLENSLVKKLQNANKDLGKGDIAGTLENLQLFIDEVTAQKGKKINPTAADALMAQAQLIIVALSAH